MTVPRLNGIEYTGILSKDRPLYLTVQENSRQSEAFIAL